jgi:hypothetical protein
VTGPSWTTEPLSATETVEATRAKGILAVGMEAAALYAFARAANVPVLCLVHVTNMGMNGGEDFEKGEADGTGDALSILERTVTALFLCRGRCREVSSTGRTGVTLLVHRRPGKSENLMKLKTGAVVISVLSLSGAATAEDVE